MTREVAGPALAQGVATEGSVAEWSASLVPAYTTAGTWVRFTSKVVLTPACWFWCGAIADDGYGRLSDHEGRVVRASRYVLAAHTGPIPAGLVAEHRLCDEPLCTRLSHLRASTQAENLDTARRRNRLGTKCRAGRADRRGMAARSRAIRDALRDPTGGGYIYGRSSSLSRWPVVTTTPARASSLSTPPSAISADARPTFGDSRGDANSRSEGVEKCARYQSCRSCDKSRLLRCERLSLARLARSTMTGPSIIAQPIDGDTQEEQTLLDFLMWVAVKLDLWRHRIAEQRECLCQGHWEVCRRVRRRCS